MNREDALRAELALYHADTSDHSERVALAAWAIASRLGWPVGACRRVRRAGRLHDIGKLSCPAAILSKAGKLTAEEWALIRRHPDDGTELLAGLITDQIVIDAVRQHHERWDGGGYPDGLAGEQIAPGARVVAVADVYDALKSDRPYKRGWSQDETVAYIREGGGALFDPVVVGAFLAVADALAALHPERTTTP